MNQNFKKILVLIIVLLIFLGLKIIQAALYVENKLIFDRSADDMISLTRGEDKYTIAVGTDGSFVIRYATSTVIFKIDNSGNIYFPEGSIKEGTISPSKITDFPTDCVAGKFISGIQAGGDLICNTP